MKTDDLISQLSLDLKPVRRPEKPWVFAVKWSVVSLAGVVLLTVFISPRTDLFQALQEIGTILEIVSFSGLLFASLLLVAWTSSPGRPLPVRYSQILLGFLALCGVVNFVRVFGIGPEVLREGLEIIGSRCTLLAVAFGVLSGGFFAFKTRQGASTNPVVSGLLVGLAALGVGGVAITLDCGSDNGMHILLWHFLLPLGVMTALGFGISKKFLRW